MHEGSPLIHDAAPRYASDCSDLVCPAHRRTPLRQVAVPLHCRQMRPPPHAFGNGPRPIRLFLIFSSGVHFDTDTPCHPQTTLPSSSQALLDRLEGYPFPEAAHVVVNLLMGGTSLPLLSIANLGQGSFRLVRSNTVITPG